MPRTQEQREEELKQRRLKVLEQVAAAEKNLEAAQKELQDRYFPSEEKFKPWALAARAKDPHREITPKEFMKDFYTDLMALLEKHREELNLGDTVIKDWESWFQGIEAEDIAALESQLDAAAKPLSDIEEKS